MKNSFLGIEFDLFAFAQTLLLNGNLQNGINVRRWQEINVGEEHERSAHLIERHVAQQIHRIEWLWYQTIGREY